MAIKTTPLPKFASIDSAGLLESVTWWRAQAQAWRTIAITHASDPTFGRTAKQGEMRCLRHVQIFQRALASHIWGR